MLSVEIDRLQALRSRPALATSSWLVDSRGEELGRYISRGRELADRALEKASTSLEERVRQLRSLSPQRTLDRGYAIAQLPSGAALRDAADAPVGTPLMLTLAKGTVRTVAEAAPSEAG
jgi:exodeoxyribonuclease VII large subunit